MSLTPPADEALEILMGHHEQPKASRVVEHLIRTEMGRLGYVLRAEEADQMQVQIRTGGRILPSVVHEGSRYVEVPDEVPDEGAYEILLHNDSHKRRLAVVSVDGINVIDGENAGRDGPGYVLRSGERLTIKGWLRDSEEAAAFRFGASEGSYASLTERGTDNVGVIGVTIFDAKQRPRTTPTGYWTRYGNPRGVVGRTNWSTTNGVLRSASARAGRDAPQSVGTEYGEAVDFATTKTRFDRAEKPVQVLQLYYATAADLEARGIPLPSKRRHPSAFPADDVGCPAPDGWRG